MSGNRIQHIWDLIRNERKEIINLYFYAILSGALQLSVPVGIQAIIGYVMGANMVASIYVLISVVVLAVFLVGALNISQMKQVEYIQQKIFTHYAIEFCEGLPKLDLNKNDRYYLPEKTNRFFETITLQKGFSKMLLDIPQASIQIFLGLLLISLYHPVFIVFSIILLLILAVIFRITGSQGIQTSHLESNYKFGLVDWLEEIARAIRSFKYSQGSHLNLLKMDGILSNYLKARNAHFRVLLFQYKTLLVIKVLITTSMLVAGSILLVNQKLNIGEFIAAEIVILSIIAAVEKLINNLDNVYDVVTGIEKLSSVIDLEKEKDGAIDLPHEKENIDLQIQQLTFAYPNTKACLRDLSYHIPAGAKVAVKGRYGSGKSTLLQILSANYRNFEGMVLFDNIPIQNLRLEALRDRIGYYAPGRRNIFKGSLYENICLGHTQIQVTDIYELAKTVGFDSTLFWEEGGLERSVDSEGRHLSDSDAYRILLMRALIGHPSLILLDEPFMGLHDSEKKSLINYLLNSTKATLIVATDDPEFLSLCHQQVTLQKVD